MPDFIAMAIVWVLRGAFLMLGAMTMYFLILELPDMARAMFRVML